MVNIRKFSVMSTIRHNPRGLSQHNKPMKGCLVALAMREMQIKNTMNCHYTPIRMAKIKKMTLSNAGEHARKLDDTCIADGKWSSHSGKYLGNFL